MPPELIPDDDEYASSEDSDFAPDAAAGNVSEDSASESDGEGDDAVATVAVKKSKKRKRIAGEDQEAEDLGIENSGDEAIIEKGLKKQKKKKGKKGKDVEEDEGGDGGLVKTRSMRAQEKVERKPLVDTSTSTIDVDAMWANMLAGKPITNESRMKPPDILPTTETKKATSPTDQRQQVTSPTDHRGSREPSTLSDGPDSMVMIKRTYNFAGKVHTEQKLVNRNSAEAKLFLASQAANPTASKETAPEAPSLTKPKRPTKKARRSIFEPAIDPSLPLRTDLHFGVRKDSPAAQRIAALAASKEAKKLTTVEKSAMDWAGFVDKEGIADELDAAGKAKGAFRDRQAFLARVENKREDEARRARLAGK